MQYRGKSIQITPVSDELYELRYKDEPPRIIPRTARPCIGTKGYDKVPDFIVWHLERQRLAFVLLDYPWEAAEIEKLFAC